jgi:hypothetical protein
MIKSSGWDFGNIILPLPKCCSLDTGGNRESKA